MAPIRVGFIGLSKNSWARNAHLPYLKTSPDYEIVALCNSTVENARQSLELFELPKSTKAYGDPQEMANDTEIDLVVCSVRVDSHFQTISPSLKAGKNVLVEWPLGKNLSEAQELLRLKNEHGVKNAQVVLQARRAPEIRKVKELIEEGRIGKVLSSDWSGYTGHAGESSTRGMKYFWQEEVGGNLVSIHFGHSVDYVQYVLGYGFLSLPKSLISTQRKTVSIRDGPSGPIIEKDLPRGAPDTIFFHGLLKSGIPLSMILRGGPFNGQPGLDWRIYGEKGEIRLTCAEPLLQMGLWDVEVELFDHASGVVEKIVVDKDELSDEGVYGKTGRNLGRVYKDVAEGNVVCSFEDAVERHEMLDGMFRENGVKSG